MSAFATDWIDLRDRILSGRLRSTKSAIWQTLIRDFPIELDPNELDRDLFRLNRNRSYSFLMKREESLSLRSEKVWLWFTFLASTAFRKKAGGSFSNCNLNKVRHGNLLGYPAYRITLQRMGLWQQYLDLCNQLNVSPDSLSTAKPFYISSIVSGLLPKTVSTGRGLRVLEIGGGTGNLAVILKKRLPIAQYVIVDLPEMLLYSSIAIRHFCPDAHVEFARSSGTIRSSDGFHFVPAELIDSVPAASFDICINIDSFQEMTREQVTTYIGFVQRVARQGGMFLNVNRRKQVADYDNNPLMYPYCSSNEVLQWETDPFLVRVLNAGRKDPHVLRVERIHA